MRKVLAFAALITGLALLIGTLAGIDNVDTGQHRQELIEEYEISIPKPTLGSTISPKPHKASNSDKAVLRIPELGNKWVYPIVAGVSDSILDSGVLGRFPESTVPGGVGNYSLTAHRVTHGEPFRMLPEVDLGDDVVLDSGGVRYTYKVTKKWVVNYKDVSVLAPVEDKRLITLITCDSLSHTDDRLIVRGFLTDASPLS